MCIGIWRSTNIVNCFITDVLKMILKRKALLQINLNLENTKWRDFSAAFLMLKLLNISIMGRWRYIPTDSGKNRHLYKKLIVLSGIKKGRRFVLLSIIIMYAWICFIQWSIKNVMFYRAKDGRCSMIFKTSIFACLYCLVAILQQLIGSIWRLDWISDVLNMVIESYLCN